MLYYLILLLQLILILPSYVLANHIPATFKRSNNDVYTSLEIKITTVLSATQLITKPTILTLIQNGLDSLEHAVAINIYATVPRYGKPRKYDLGKRNLVVIDKKNRILGLNQ